MSLLDPYAHMSFLGRGGGLLSSDPATYRRQMSRIQRCVRGDRFNAKKNRKLRNARYQQYLRRSQMGEEAARLYESNPKQLGGPRMFKVLVAGQDAYSRRKLHDPDSYHDEGHYVFFPAFGAPKRPMLLNNGWIAPDDIQVTPEGNIYTVITRDVNGGSLSLFLDFTTLNRPTGQIFTDQGQYAVMLQPYAVTFDVKVAANSGAYDSSGQGGLIWDATSSQWQSASWDDTMDFQYDTVAESDPFGGTVYYNEAAYIDRETGDVFSLDRSGTIGYTAVMDGSDPSGAVFTIAATNPNDVPPPPEVRVNSAIKSVFPSRTLLRFDGFATSFMGAYVVPHSDTVYGVVGTAQSPFGDALLPAMPQKPSVPPFKSIIKPGPRALHSTAPQTSQQLSVVGLTALNPMEQVPGSTTEFRDVVSQAANKDFSDIIAYHMDEDLRNTFIQSTPVVFDDSTVQAIALDSGDNSTFYKTLQVPYVTSSLARSTLPEAKECNGVRAQAQLQQLPTESATSGTVSRMLKSLTGTFNVLENGQTNPDSKSFQQAFNDVVRVFMMTSMIPQFVDANGVSGDFDSRHGQDAGRAGRYIYHQGHPGGSQAQRLLGRPRWVCRLLQGVFRL
ncbi:hypothetical protein MAJ_05144, partial [Metarhizium majus ARSEF 297]